MSRASEFKRLMLDPKILVVPSAYDALSARVIEQAGFPAVHMTGSGTSAAMFGLPDPGFATVTEMAWNAKNICLAVGLPVIMDLDAGYGNAMNTWRCISEFEQAGIVGTLPADGPEQVGAAVAVLGAAGPTPLATDRRKVLSRAAGLISRRATEFAALITAEAGICRIESALEVERAVGNLRVAAVEAEWIRGESIPVPSADRLAVTVPEPIGVVAAITPFNRPLNQVVVKVAPAVAAGCPIAVKPSERTPLTAGRFAEVLVEAGLAPDRLAVLVGRPREVGPPLVGHPEVGHGDPDRQRRHRPHGGGDGRGPQAPARTGR
ncbi:aldehyde dehydrogenase family protein [Streptomyces sp. CWNU-52B]|uniref:aldehyde dehydrogenase family protein n=1 Tax=unclassified Streptomyces TaxID=2593676 RepID=UPI0039BF839A